MGGAVTLERQFARILGSWFRVRILPWKPGPWPEPFYKVEWRIETMTTTTTEKPLTKNAIKSLTEW